MRCDGFSVFARHRTARGWACVSGHMPGPPEDVVAFTSAHSRSYTALAAMHRLGLRPRCRGVLRLLCLGADRREGTSPESTAAVFGALRGDARRRGAFPGRERTQGWTYDEVMRGVERVEIVLVGPNVTLETRVTPNVFHDVFHDARDDDGASRLPTRVAYLRGLYHELATPKTGALLLPLRDTEVTEWVPDLALAYNAGVWGYAPSEWAPTFFALTRDARAPVACTGYSLAELENDEESLEAMSFPSFPSFPENENERVFDETNERVVNHPKQTKTRGLVFAWPSEPNPFASRLARALRFPRDAYDGAANDAEVSREKKQQTPLRENDAWLCVAVDEKTIRVKEDDINT